MIEHSEAQQIHDDLIRELHQMVRTGTATAADRNVLRQMLKDNEFQGIMGGSAAAPLRSVSSLPFPVDKAAHAPDAQPPQAAAQ